MSGLTWHTQLKVEKQVTHVVYTYKTCNAWRVFSLFHACITLSPGTKYMYLFLKHHFYQKHQGISV